MKRRTIFLLVLLSLSLAGCTNNSKNSGSIAVSKKIETTNYLTEDTKIKKQSLTESSLSKKFLNNETSSFEMNRQTKERLIQNESSNIDNQTIATTSSSLSTKESSTSLEDSNYLINDSESRRDGFNFKGFHFDLSSFSGSGAVPQKTPYVFQWTDDPSHYLFERNSEAGNAVWNINVGDTVTIEGTSYSVFKIDNSLSNDSSLYDYLKEQHATVTWQTCDSSLENSTLSLWYAK